MAHRAFWVPKEGAGAEEYEDAFAFSEEASPEEAEARAPFRAAVADGATEAAFSRRWARLLAERFVQHGPAVLAGALPAAQEAWAASVDAQALPWYGAAKAEAGAFAALLGLTLYPPADGTGRWRAASVGDCNLFHLRGGRLLHAWPRAKPEAFGSRPVLVPSPPGAQAVETQTLKSTFQPGDAFVLTTDAAAAWLLEIDGPQALAWDDQDAFATAVHTARADGALKNDDTTVAVIQVT